MNLSVRGLRTQPFQQAQTIDSTARSRNSHHQPQNRASTGSCSAFRTKISKTGTHSCIIAQTGACGGPGYSEDNSMEQPGERLKVARRRLKLTYRDVEQASLTIAKRRRNDEFVVALSRLADIENKGTVPTIYRIYTLCAVYRLDFDEVLGWYGVPRKELAFESSQVEIAETHALNFVPETLANVPLSLDSEIDRSKTTFLSQILRRWGILPFNILQGIDLKGHRYGWIGSEDWSMYPIVPPGSLVVIDDTRRKVASGGWTN